MSGKNTEVFQKGCKRQKLWHKQCNETFIMNHYFRTNANRFWLCILYALTQNKHKQNPSSLGKDLNPFFSFVLFLILLFFCWHILRYTLLNLKMPRKLSFPFNSNVICLNGSFKTEMLPIELYCKHCANKPVFTIVTIWNRCFNVIERNKNLMGGLGNCTSVLIRQIFSISF